MDKRFVIFIILSFAIIVGWSLLNKPEVTPPPEPERTALEESAPAEEPGELETALQDEQPIQPEYEGGVSAEVEETVVLETDLFRAELTNRGGRVKSWKFKEYSGPDGGPLEILPCFEENDIPLPLGVDLDDPVMSEEINNALFKIEQVMVPAEKGHGPGTRIVFEWADGRGIEVRKEITAHTGDYLVDLDLEIIDRGRRLPARLTWGPGFEVQDQAPGKSTMSYYAYTGQVVANIDGVVSRTKSKKVQEGRAEGNLMWAGLEDQYFTALILPSGDRNHVRLWTKECHLCPKPEDGQEADTDQDGEQLAMIAVTVPADGAMLYVGPKKYRKLQALGYELEKVVWFSSYTILEAIAKFLLLALLWIYDNVVQNYGLAIILATFGLRLILFPLNQYSMVRMRRTQVEMQALQPKINAIKNRYRKKKDAESRQKMNAEMMALYKQEGVNPMGGVVGCVPMLAQFPILIGFYNMLTVAIELRGAPFFGWIQDLSLKDPFWIFPILMGVSMFLQQRLSQTKTTDPTQKQQQRIMMFMPFFFTFICTKMPSGMVLYWFANNLLGIGQQWLVNRRTGTLKGAAQKAKA